MQICRTLILAGLFAFTSLVRGADLSPDPFLGRWELDAKASQYAPGTCPRRMTIEMTHEARGIHYHSETQPVSGVPFHVDYTANYDGKPAVVTGDYGILLPVALTRIDSHRVKASYANGFQVEATSERVVSEDGKTMTITTTSQDKLGQRRVNVGIYQRVSIH